MDVNHMAEQLLTHPQTNANSSAAAIGGTVVVNVLGPGPHTGVGTDYQSLGAGSPCKA